MSCGIQKWSAHFLFETAESITARNIIGILLAWLWVVLTEEFYHMESALIDVEVDIPLFKIGRVGLPDFRFLM